MVRSKRLTAIFTLVSFLSVIVSASSYASVSLQDALDAAIEKQKQQFVSAEMVEIEDKDFLSWLDGAPFVSISALRSQEDLGTDESEIGLTLPIKSQLRRSIEKKLQSNSTLLKESTNRQQALYLSGQIRELVWEARMLGVRISTAKDKVDMLERLNITVQALSESRVVPEYIALLLEKESIDSTLALLDYEYQMSNLMSEYNRLTGLRALPTSIQENFDEAASFTILSHPDITLLDGGWQYFARTFEANNKEADPWHLTLTARRVAIPAFSENQIGIGVEIPLSIGNQYTALQRAEYEKGQTEYQFAKQRLSNALASTFEKAKRDLAYLERKQQVLNEGEEPIKKLENIIPGLLRANLENKETVIRSALEVIDARANIELNQVALQKQISMLKQAAGISL